MISRYTAICIQSTRVSVSHRKEILDSNLRRCLDLIDFAAPRFSLPDYAPTRLILFPEVFMQGWIFEGGSYSSPYERVAKEMAIEIPGEETRLLGEKAKTYKTYIAGTAMEVDPHIGPWAFNCAFIIDPNGEVIYKRHKYTPAISHTGKSEHAHPADGISPHDLYERYFEAMDGRYGRKKGNVLSCFFPVVETDIGKLGYVICMEGWLPESFRALGIQGCEVTLRSSGNVIPWSLTPYDSWDLQNRSAALDNMMYVIACGPGGMGPTRAAIVSSYYPSGFYLGESTLVDFNGVIMARQGQGETMAMATVDIEDLRARREDSTMNYIPLIRTEVFREMYSEPIYPKNLFIAGFPKSFRDRMDAQPMKEMFRKGIYVHASIRGER